MLWNQMPLIETPETDIFLDQGRAVWLQLIPTELPSDAFGVHELRDAAHRSGYSLRPLMNAHWEYLMAEDGFGICEVSDKSKSPATTPSVAFAFTTGEVWSIDTWALNYGRDMIYFGEIAPRLIRRFREYVRFLGALGINPPFHWIAGLEGVSRMKLAVPTPVGFESFGGPTCMSPKIVDGALYDGTVDAALALDSFFTKIFKKCGSIRPEHLQDPTSFG
jgi:hypothetical protein